MITTVLRNHTKQYHHKSRFTRYLQYFRDVGPSHIVTNCTLDFANSTLGFARAFGENSKLVGGKLVFYAVFKVLRSCCSPLLPTVLSQHCCFRGGVGGGHDDVQAASRTPRTTSKTNPPTLRSGL